MIVLVDIGNTRIKWAVFDYNDIIYTDSKVHSDISNINTESKFFSKIINSWQEFNPKRILIASVLSSDINNVLNAEIDNILSIEPEYITVNKSFKKLKNGYTKYQQLGVDRWLNLIGAYNSYNILENKQAFCVIDCGSALTVDAVDNTAKHIGGFIVPGLNMLEKSLLSKTSLIKNNIDKAKKLAKPRKNNYFLANNTAHGVAGGINYLIMSYLDRIIDDLSSILGDDYKIFITGGDADKIHMMLTNINNNKNIILEHNLIWLGMINLL